jgi:hypothetical protein
MGVKRSKKTELDQLKIILEICKRNAPDTLKDQNERIAKKIKELSKKGKKRRGKV